MNSIAEWAKSFVENYGLLAVFVTMVLEGALVPIPSEVVVPLGGVLAAQHHVALWEVVAVASFANLVGSVIIYLVGRYGGRELILRYGRHVRLSVHHLESTERWFRRRGQWTVFFTRMLPGVRSFVSLPAGIARMPLLRFALLTTLGSIPWNLALAYLGYLFGSNWEQLQGYFRQYDLLLLVLGACAVVAAIAWGRWHRRRTNPAE